MEELEDPVEVYNELEGIDPHIEAVRSGREKNKRQPL